VSGPTPILKTVYEMICVNGKARLRSETGRAEECDDQNQKS